jgi:serine/threonine protein kinase
MNSTAYNPVWIGDHRIDIAKHGYIAIEPVGQGAYGLVFSAMHLTEGSTQSPAVAIKKLDCSEEGLTSLSRLQRELSCMREMNHPNILRLIDVLSINQDVYIVSELMETDLGSVLKSGQPLSNDQVLALFYQLVDGIRYIHDCGVIHRDLKPRNVLINTNCDLKICDFGLARLEEFNGEPFTEYMCTRWYRAPEILTPALIYTNKIDIFSLGCIMAEVLGRKPLLPGKDAIKQFELIMRRLGRLSDVHISTIKNSTIRKHLRRLNSSVSVAGDMEVYLGVTDNEWSLEVALLTRKLICFDPFERPSAREIIDWHLFQSFQPHRTWIAPNRLREILRTDLTEHINRLQPHSLA